MKTELKEISPTQREIRIEIEPEAVKEVYTKVSQKYAKAANVPGFRKGFAPLDVVRLRFREEIQNEVLRELLPEKVQAAIVEHELQPLAEPQLHFDDWENMKLNGSQPLSLHIHVEVMPEIPTPEYAGLEVTRRVKPVGETELSSIIDQRRQGAATLIPVEGRKAENGDTVIVDLEGTFEGEPEAEPIRADDLEITLGDEIIEASFTENLNGVEQDEEREFTVSYPADFSSPALAGKTVHYKAKVKSVGRVELPELDDEWAKSLDEGYDSLVDLKQRLSKDLETVSNSDADARVRTELINQLIQKHEFEIPNTLIDAQARNLLNNFAQDMAQRGVDLNKVEKEFIQMAYNQMRSQAEVDVRGAMLLEKIAEVEKIEVSDAEVAEELEKMSQYYGVPADEIRKSIEQQQGGDQTIANNLRTRKAVEALVSKAKINEGEWIDEAQQEIEADADADAEEKSKGKAKKAKAEKAADETAETEEKPKKKSAKKEKSA
jgi:trigger factor